MTGPAPLISIVVPVYNMEKYLGRCLDSLLGQSLEDLEVICVDDGSADRSLEVLKSRAAEDRRLRVFSQANQGVSLARAKALEQARGRYLAFVDPDDWLEPETCGLAAQIMESDPELDFVVWGSRLVYDEAPAPGSEESRLAQVYRVNFQGRQAVTAEAKLNTVANVCNKMLRREIVGQYEISFPGFPVGEDGAFWHKYAGHAKYGYYIDQPLYNYYRGRPESATVGLKNKALPRFNWFSIFDDIYKHYEKHGLLNDEETAFLAHVFIIMYLTEIHRVSKSSLIEERRAVRRKARELLFHYGLPDVPGHVIKYVKAGLDHERAGYSLAEKIFSIKNRYHVKVLSILGLEFKFSRRAKD